MSEIIGEACRRFPSIGQSGEDGADRTLDGSAWTEAALALIDLELPQWQVRRIAYDGGEWYCALSRERELPDWLDHSIEARHPIWRWRSWAPSSRRSAFAAPSSRPSVPTVSRDANPLYEPVCCDHFA